MDNVSTIDDFPNITRNFTDEVYQRDETPYDRIFLEMFTLVGLLSVVSNCLLIFVILKYKKMREDATNMIFLHINILQAFYLLASPLTLRVGIAFWHLSSVHEAAFCVSYQVLTSIMFGIIWFLFLLIWDWFLKLYYKDKYVKFCRAYKFFLICLYVLIILISAVTVQFCFHYYMVFLVYLTMFACAVLMVIFLIIINVVHAFKKRKLIINPTRGNLGLAMANICFFVWTPIIAFILINFIWYINAPLLIIFLFSFGFSSPIINLFYLFFYDDNYNVFLKQVFRCRCNEYKNESLEDQSVTYNDANGVHIVPEN